MNTRLVVAFVSVVVILLFQAFLVGAMLNMVEDYYRLKECMEHYRKYDTLLHPFPCGPCMHYVCIEINRSICTNTACIDVPSNGRIMFNDTSEYTEFLEDVGIDKRCAVLIANQHGVIAGYDLAKKMCVPSLLTVAVVVVAIFFWAISSKPQQAQEKKVTNRGA